MINREIIFLDLEKSSRVLIELISKIILNKYMNIIQGLNWYFYNL